MALKTEINVHILPHGVLCKVIRISVQQQLQKYVDLQTYLNSIHNLCVINGMVVNVCHCGPYGV